MKIIRFYRTPAVSDFIREEFIKKNKNKGIEDLQTESCFYVASEQELTVMEIQKLQWLLSETFEQEKFNSFSFFEETYTNGRRNTILEIGPRLNFTSPWSTNAVMICKNCGLENIMRIEKSIRYAISSSKEISNEDISFFLDQVQDKMTECRYFHPIESFGVDEKPLPTKTVSLIEKGEEILHFMNKEMGLSFDEQDIDFYLKMFIQMGRNPTDVELFDLSQSNSEHSRHWFFRGRIIIDNKEMPESLMDIVKGTLKLPNNSILAFCDNSSAISGYQINIIIPQIPGKPSPFVRSKESYDIIFTAETHNFPTGVAPRPGAETGIGGRIRDVHSTGRGGLVIAGTAGYCVGNLQIPGYILPWEDLNFIYPKNTAAPLKIIIEASNGASDYGNKFGEPIIQGFTRSFGLILPNEERREWIKPIMFTGGIGQMDHRHAKKISPQKGMLVVKIGGPAYRIGIGGGSASSLVQGENKENLDFNAVQRGDAEMENKLNRVIKSCIELGKENPIISIHDQGAGGSANVLKEIVDPEGACIELRKIMIGDKTLSVLEIWGAEYQENDALLINEDNRELFENICKRERLPVSFVGFVTGDGRIKLHDEWDDTYPVDLDLKVLGKFSPKLFFSNKISKKLANLILPDTISIYEILGRVLRLVSVGSKLFLTNKVDRSVSGLISQQQCVGPLQLPLSNCGVVAQSHFGITGAITAIGEQPIKGLLDNKAMARMTVGEMLTNIMWAKISSLEHIKCSANWMWAAKMPGEGAEMYDAALSMKEIMIKLGIAVDGGKDSLSMATTIKKSLIKSPGSLVLSGYVTCPDITKTITPNIKHPGSSFLIFLDLSKGNHRTGGSALAQVFNQIGSECPDVEDVDLLSRCFKTVQKLLDKELISAGHDRSDGGLLITLLEMAFSGNCGIQMILNLSRNDKIVDFLFCEEIGVVIEVRKEFISSVLNELDLSQIPYITLGNTTEEKLIRIKIKEGTQTITILNEDMSKLRDMWNETSYHLELLQANPICVEQEFQGLKYRKGLSYNYSPTCKPKMNEIFLQPCPKIAILREEGSNGDREMASAFFKSGFDVWDVTMSDLIDKKIHLNEFMGLAFVGGFSYADVMDSAKGWAGLIRFNKDIWDQFEIFYNRKETFSLGVCNGCQLMALLGYVPYKGLSNKDQPRFISNFSRRFESRFSLVKIMPSPSIMLKGLEGSILGIWVSHGEGRSHFQNEKILERVTIEGAENNLAPVRYVDDNHNITEMYPFNPNGSPKGIASLCSQDGRHLAMMPHPERSIYNWQWPFGILTSEEKGYPSPWLKMFQNAREYCLKSKEKL